MTLADGVSRTVWYCQYCGKSVDARSCVPNVGHKCKKEVGI